MKTLKKINQIGPYAIAVGVLYWPFEAAIHAFVFDEGHFFDMLLLPGINELWMRSLTSASFIFLGFFANAMQRQQLQLIKKLKQQELRSRRIIETAYDAYISIDSESRITGWNPQAEAIFGWPRSAVMGKLLTDTIIPEQHKQAHLQGIERYLRTSSGPWLYKTIRAQAVTRAGNEIKVEMAIIPLANGDQQEFYTFIRQVSPAE